MKLSIIIPCYPPHFKYLPRLIKNLSESTTLPDDIIIACSECTNAQKQKILNELSTLIFVPLIILNTTSKQTAGQNRNRGAQASTADYLLFTDANDFYHKQRIEIMYQLAEKYNPNLLLHNWFWQKQKTCLDFTVDLDDINITYPEVIHAKTFGKPAKRNVKTERPEWGGMNISSNNTVTDGVALVKKTVFEKIKYSNLRMGEDGKFCHDVLWSLGEVYTIDTRLISHESL